MPQPPPPRTSCCCLCCRMSVETGRHTIGIFRIINEILFFVSSVLYYSDYWKVIVETDAKLAEIFTQNAVLKCWVIFSIFSIIFRLLLDFILLALVEEEEAASTLKVLMIYTSTLYSVGVIALVASDFDSKLVLLFIFLYVPEIYLWCGFFIFPFHGTDEEQKDWMEDCALAKRLNRRSIAHV